MFGRRGSRKQTLRAWRRRRAGDTAPPIGEVPGIARVRSRRRAPTPRIVPSAAHVGTWFARPLRIGFLALIVATALSAGLVWRSERFRLSGAYVMGNSRVPAESVYAASGLAGRHAFAVRRHQAASRIESLPDVREAHVKITLPNHVVITVAETEPRLIWETRAGRMAIDDNSYSVFPPADAAELVHVTDEVGLIASTGQRLPADLLEAALAYGEHFERLIYRRDVGFVAHTDAGLEVRLGTDGHEVERQMLTLAALEAQLAKEHGPVAYVDVRFVDHPYFRLLQGAD